jgi:hypothetical protein
MVLLFLEEKICTYSRFDSMVVKSARRMGIYVVFTFFYMYVILDKTIFFNHVLPVSSFDA